MINAPKEALYECGKCGLKMGRQLNAAINLYLQMEGLSPGLELFEELCERLHSSEPSSRGHKNLSSRFFINSKALLYL